MALETATYPADLVTTNPVSGDPVSQADDHLRLIKSVVKTAAAGPAFSAYQSVLQTFTNGVAAKVNLQTEDYDTNTCFASSRFTPNVPGYYHFTASITFTSQGAISTSIYKNGAEAKRGVQFNSNGLGAQVSGDLYMNGTTDYVEFWAFQSSGADQTPLSATSATVYFSGYLARLA